MPATAVSAHGSAVGGVFSGVGGALVISLMSPAAWAFNWRISLYFVTFALTWMTSPIPILTASNTSGHITIVIEPVASVRMIRTGPLLPSWGSVIVVTLASTSTVESTAPSLIEPRPSVLVVGVALT